MPIREVIIAKLYRFLASFDTDGDLRVPVASTRSQQSGILEDVGHGLRGHELTCSILIFVFINPTQQSSIYDRVKEA